MAISDLSRRTPPTPSTAVRHRRADLQGMRALAVLTVFANHLFGWPPGGFVGVDVFFVLSGFFITSILITERTGTGSVSFRNFYIRRVKRILPSALLVLAATVAAAYFLLPAARAKQTLLDALYAAIFAANFRFEAVGADYFQQNTPPSPLQHYWSLSIEEQFYFVWPALLVAIFALTRYVRRRGSDMPPLWGLLAAMSLIVAASFGWAMMLSADDPNRAYFSTMSRVWELGIGALVAIAGPWLTQIPNALRPMLGYVGLAGVVLSLFLINPHVQFPAPWAALPVLSTAVVVASFHGAEPRGMYPLTNRVAGYLGDTSYTLYLWHWPVIVLLGALIPPGGLFYATVLALAFGLTAITYRFYEDPIRKSGWLVSGSRRFALRSSAWAAIAVIAVAAVVLSILGIRYSDARSAAAAEIAAASNDPGRPSTSIPTTESADPCFGAPAMVNDGCALRNTDNPLQPSVDDVAGDLPREAGKCYTLSNSELLTCEFGYTGEDAKRIALVGDSHATLLIPPLKQILNDNKWNLTTYTGHECALMQPTPQGCAAMMATTTDELLAHPYDLVLVANYNFNKDPQNYVKVWSRLTAAGTRVAVLVDNPESSKEAIACVTRVSFSGDHTGECGTPRNEAFPFPDDALVGAAKLLPGTTVIDLTSYYCAGDRCPSVIGDVIVYRDTNHITATFAKTLAPALQNAIQHALGAPMAPR